MLPFLYKLYAKKIENSDPKIDPKIDLKTKSKRSEVRNENFDRINPSGARTSSFDIPMTSHAYLSTHPIIGTQSIPENTTTTDRILISEQNLIFRPRQVAAYRRSSAENSASAKTVHVASSERAQAFHDVLVLRAERAERRKSTN